MCLDRVGKFLESFRHVQVGLAGGGMLRPMSGVALLASAANEVNCVGFHFASNKHDSANIGYSQKKLVLPQLGLSFRTRAPNPTGSTPIRPEAPPPVENCRSLAVWPCHPGERG